jgi:hypothetical protein
MLLYLNGELIGSHNVIGIPWGWSQVDLSHPGEALDGLLDEVTIYNRALSAEEISAIYEAGSSGKAGKAEKAGFIVTQSNIYIQNLSNDAFKDNAILRKESFSLKFDSVLAQIDAGEYQAARNKLQNDISQKCDGEEGDPKTRDWITDPRAQQDLIVMIDVSSELLCCDIPWGS